MTNAAAPLPSTDDLTGQFYHHLALGELRLQRCLPCGKYRHLPRYLCPSCHSDQWEWAVSSGEGEVYSWTTTMRPLHPAFTDTPYTIATIAMTEGPRILARLRNVAPDAINVGLKVIASFLPLVDDVALVEFVPCPTE